MALNATEQTSIARQYSDETHVALAETAGVDSPEIIASAVGLDAFVTANAAAIIAAIGPAFVAATTTSDELRLFKIVLAHLELQ